MFALFFIIFLILVVIEGLTKWSPFADYGPSGQSYKMPPSNAVWVPEDQKVTPRVGPTTDRMAPSRAYPNGRPIKQSGGNPLAVIFWLAVVSIPVVMFAQQLILMWN